MSEETRNMRFKRLATLRGERILKDLRLLGNLSNKNNYDYSDVEINKLFNTIESELKVQKTRFVKNRLRGIDL